MGGSESKQEVDNKGLANGNVINNGHIEFENNVNSELKHMEITLYLNFAAKIILIVIILLKWYTKKVRRNQNLEQRINEVVLQNLRKGDA